MWNSVLSHNFQVATYNFNTFRKEVLNSSLVHILENNIVPHPSKE